MTMHVYIAGPMTGYEEYNHPAFLRAESEWRKAGYDAVTPVEANNAVWQKHFGRDFDARTDVCDYGDPLLREILAADLALLATADAVALLPGWRKSRGANLELAVASSMGLPVFDAITRESLAQESALEEAQRLVHGDRGADYGHPIVDYKATGRMWGALLERHFGFDVPDVPPRLATLMMAAVKLSREAGKHKRDNLTDTAGYAECAQMIADRESA